jgi:long-chain fatty acid transport protein
LDLFTYPPFLKDGERLKGENEMKKKLILAAALLFSAFSTAKATEGINLIGIGPVQQGTAGAGVASAKDSTWLILNPAGLTDVGKRVDTSFQYFAPVRTINSSANPGAGNQSDDAGFFIPSLSGSFGCCRGEGGHIGIGLYGTSGMGVDYGQPRVGFATGDTHTELSIAKMTAIYAQAFDNGFSIGAGPVFVLSRFQTDMFNPGTGLSESDKWDTSVGAGAIIGANQKIGDKLKVGGSYMSEQVMTEFNEYNKLFNNSLNLPQQVTVGMAYNVRTNLEVALDYRWIGWNKLSTLGDQFGWEDQRIVKAGLTWNATERLTLRTGVSHGNSPIGKEDVFANALFPAIMKTHVACGASYEFDKFTLHFAFIHGLKEKITDNTGGFGSGTQVTMYQNSATIGASWKF